MYYNLFIPVCQVIRKRSNLNSQSKMPDEREFKQALSTLLQHVQLSVPAKARDNGPPDQIVNHSEHRYAH